MVVCTPPSQPIAKCGSLYFSASRCNMLRINTSNLRNWTNGLREELACGTFAPFIFNASTSAIFTLDRIKYHKNKIKQYMNELMMDHFNLGALAIDKSHLTKTHMIPSHHSLSFDLNYCKGNQIHAVNYTEKLHILDPFHKL